MRVELTDAGYLVLPAQVAQRCFGEASSAQVAIRDRELWALALAGGAVGGLLLKRRNRAGDRSVLVVEELRRTKWEAGLREAIWDEGERALRVPLTPGSPSSQRDGRAGADRREGPVPRQNADVGV